MSINTYQNRSFVSLVTPDNYSASSEGSAIDTQNYNGIGSFILHQKGGAGTNPTLNVKIQHATTSGGTYADVSGATFSEATSAAGIEAIEVQMSSLRRYIRAKNVLGGTNPTFDFGVSAVLPNKG